MKTADFEDIVREITDRTALSMTVQWQNERDDGSVSTRRLRPSSDVSLADHICNCLTEADIPESDQIEVRLYVCFYFDCGFDAD